MIGLLWQGLAWALGAFAGRLIFALGLGVVAYQGMDLVMGHVHTYVDGLVGQMGARSIEVWNACGANVAISMLFAAYTVRFATGTVTRLALRRP